jgi:hypothetical protein
MKKHCLLLGVLPGILILALTLGGCAKPPTVEMEAAVQAVTRAENDPDAIAYGGTSLARAREALARMQEEAAAKRYDAAKTLAIEAAGAAEKAVSDGRAGAARARQEAANLINGLRVPLAETENAINAAKRVSNIQIDFDLIDQEYETARETVDQAQVSLSNNNFKDVTEKCQTVRAALSGINSRLADASQAVFRKK